MRLSCGHAIEKKPKEYTGGTGYGIDENRKKICYECCALRDKATMRENGKITLYLVPIGSSYEVTNWPGTLRLPVHTSRTGRHNIARTRTNVWFTFEGAQWYGVQYGDWSTICHCKRLKV
jgi:hypothetical protein